MSGVPGYQLERLIGRGATGEVWLARQRSAGGRVVAIKRVPTGDSRTTRDHLRSEGELLASLDHPHILTLYDVVDCAGGLALVMQYAGGGSLAGLLQQRRLTPGQLVSTALPLADALAYAHARGVIHADVTPANVLFTEDARPLLADFGIARATRPLVARSGLSGTPDYLDPELADGAPPDARSDIYGLGVICWEALAGRLPHSGGSPFEIVERARAAERPPLADLAPETPLALVAVIETALARRREGRYGDAAQFAAALASVAGPEPVTLLPRLVDGPVGPPARPTREFGPRPPRPVAAAAAEARARGRRRPRRMPRRGTLRRAPRARHRSRALDGRALDGRALDGRVLDGRALDGRAQDGRAQPPPGLGSPRRVRLAVLVLVLVAVAGGVAVTAGRATARGPVEPLARAQGAVAVPAEDWRAVLAGLDARRAEAFAYAEPQLLGEVYAPGEPLRVDTARVTALASAGERVLGLRLTYVDVEVIERGAGRVRLVVTDELSPYRRVTATGALLQRYAGRAGRQWTVELVASSSGWRIAAVTPASS